MSFDVSAAKDICYGDERSCRQWKLGSNLRITGNVFLDLNITAQIREIFLQSRAWLLNYGKSDLELSFN